MSNKTTSSQPAATTLTGTELFPCIQGGNSRRATADQIIARAALKDNNLSDLPSPSAARANLSVYSQAEVDALVVGLLDFKGNIDCSANPNYPAASKGDTYLVSVAGMIGGGSGVSVQVGDSVVASADNAGGDQATVGTSWFFLERNAAGDPLLDSDVATAAEFRANTADKILDTDSVWDAAAFVTLSDSGGTIALDLDSGINFQMTMDGDYTLSNPTNAKEGQTGCIQFTQDGTGTQALAFDTSYVFADSAAPTLSTAAGAIDLLFYLVLPGGNVFITDKAGAIG